MKPPDGAVPKLWLNLHPFPGSPTLHILFYTPGGVTLVIGVIPKSLPVLSTEPVLRKAAINQGLRFSTEYYGFDRGTTSLTALKVHYFSVYFYIFWVLTVSEIVCYCLSGFDV